MPQQPFYSPLTLCRCLVLLGWSAIVHCSAARGADPYSAYPLRPEDPLAAYFHAGMVEAGGDATAALQRAIDDLERERSFGVVYVGPGDYRLSGTVYIWKGIRLIGYGASRPRFLLPPSSSGFDGEEPRYLFHFASDMPAPGEAVRDANPGTFYSALSNVVIEIGAGNPGAVGVRSHFAQHCFLANIDFRIGDGRAGVDEVGNLIENCRFFGGAYGIMTKKPSPSWPFVLMDSSFEGQRTAAILTEEAGMTIVRTHFSDTPSAIVTRPDRAEELYVEDSVFKNIAGPAIVISDEYNARPQYNLRNVQCESVPELARFRLSGKSLSGPSHRYAVRSFTHGAHIDGLGVRPVVKTSMALEPIDSAAPAVRVPASGAAPLPPMESWIDVTSFGLVGDGETDNTASLRAAIAHHSALFFPSGRYRILDTVVLRDGVALIGMSPITTQIVIAEDTAAFTGAGAAKAMIETSRGGTNWVVGLGIDTAMAPPPEAYTESGLRERRWWNRQKKNGPVPNRAVGIQWMANAESLLSDVRFLGGHGTHYADGTPVPHYNANRSGDTDPERRWDSQYASLWVTEGGGGSFVNIWTPNPHAQAGIIIEDTETPGRVYQVSSEHHVRNELIVRRTHNWRFYAFQCEEEAGEGSHALPVRIEDSRDLQFANLYLYRVMRTATPFPMGVLLQNCDNIEFSGVHAYGPSKFTYDDTIFDASSGLSIRSREIAKLIASSQRSSEAKRPKSEYKKDDQSVRLLASGFSNIDNLEIDPDGNAFFVDAARQSIYRWSDSEQAVKLVCDAPIEPVGLVAWGPGQLLVANRVGQVYALDTNAVGSKRLTALEASDRLPISKRIAFPGTRWRDEHNFLAAAAAAPTHWFVSPDESLALAADQTFADALSGSSRFSTIDLVRTYDIVAASPGERVFVADEFGQKTYSLQLSADGSLSDPQLFAEEGEGAVVAGPDDLVYLCAGQVLVFNQTGKEISQIAVPERPSSIAFGGEDGRTLFIAARSSLYSYRLR